MEHVHFLFLPLFWVKIDLKVWDVATGWLCQFAALSSALKHGFFQDLKISCSVNEATKRFKEPHLLHVVCVLHICLLPVGMDW